MKISKLLCFVAIQVEDDGGLANIMRNLSTYDVEEMLELSDICRI